MITLESAFLFLGLLFVTATMGLILLLSTASVLVIIRRLWRWR